MGGGIGTSSGPWTMLTPPSQARDEFAGCVQTGLGSRQPRWTLLGKSLCWGQGLGGCSWWEMVTQRVWSEGPRGPLPSWSGRHWPLLSLLLGSSGTRPGPAGCAQNAHRVGLLYGSPLSPSPVLRERRLVRREGDPRSYQLRVLLPPSLSCLDVREPDPVLLPWGQGQSYSLFLESLLPRCTLLALEQSM